MPELDQNASASTTMPGRRFTAVLGVALALGFPFFNYGLLQPFGLSYLADYSDALPALVIKLGVVIGLAAIAFGIERRSAAFFRIRRFGWRDVGAMLATMYVEAGLISLLALTVFRGVENPVGQQIGPDASVAMRVAVVLAAGIGEEFVFRGFLIEELGELSGSRPMAGVVSVVSFAAAHHGSYGWSVWLVFPLIGGLALTILYFWRKNLPLCMLMHVIVDVIGEFFGYR